MKHVWVFLSIAALVTGVGTGAFSDEITVAGTSDDGGKQKKIVVTSDDLEIIGEDGGTCDEKIYIVKEGKKEKASCSCSKCKKAVAVAKPIVVKGGKAHAYCYSTDEDGTFTIRLGDDQEPIVLDLKDLKSLKGLKGLKDLKGLKGIKVLEDIKGTCKGKGMIITHSGDEDEDIEIMCLDDLKDLGHPGFAKSKEFKGLGKVMLNSLENMVEVKDGTLVITTKKDGEEDVEVIRLGDLAKKCKTFKSDDGKVFKVLVDEDGAHCDVTCEVEAEVDTLLDIVEEDEEDEDDLTDTIEDLRDEVRELRDAIKELRKNVEKLKKDKKSERKRIRKSEMI